MRAVASNTLFRRMFAAADEPTATWCDGCTRPATMLFTISPWLPFGNEMPASEPKTVLLIA